MRKLHRAECNVEKGKDDVEEATEALDILPFCSKGSGGINGLHANRRKGVEGCEKSIGDEGKREEAVTLKRRTRTGWRRRYEVVIPASRMINVEGPYSA